MDSNTSYTLEAEGGGVRARLGDDRNGEGIGNATCAAPSLEPTGVDSRTLAGYPSRCITAVLRRGTSGKVPCERELDVV